MKFNLNTVFLIISCFAFIIQKNVSRLAQSNEESEEDSVSTPDDATESSDKTSPEDDGTIKSLQQKPINQLFEK